MDHDESELDRLWGEPEQDEEFDSDDGMDDDATEDGRDLRVSIDRIRPAAYQARKHFSEEGIDELADSIGQHGVLEPLLVRWKDGGYELIAGERRLRAAERAELEEVPVRVRRATDAQAEIWSIVENVQREDISAWEEAEAFVEIRLRRKARGEATSGAAVSRAFGWSEAKGSERFRIIQDITPEVWHRARVTSADLCGLSKAVLLRAAQADTVEARADILRAAVHPPDGGSGGIARKKKRGPPSAPAGAYSMKESANGVTTIRIKVGRMTSQLQQQAASDLEDMLARLRGASSASASSAPEVR